MTTAPTTNAKWDRSFFGHPLGLLTLFFTELQERFSYYGMRSLLMLFMAAGVDKGGLGFSVAKAGAIYGLYTSMVYLVSLPGGWIADRILGQRKAVLWGGIVIACGHFSMAYPGVDTFYAGLVLIVIGTGLLKPNISTMVGALYRPGDPRRDSGFSIFYMGINVGAFFAPIVCGYLGQNINWHYGFGAAGIGMTLGLIFYISTGRFLGQAGFSSNGTPDDRRRMRVSLGTLAGIAALLVLLSATGVVALTAERISDGLGIVLTVVLIAIFAWLFTDRRATPEERSRYRAIFVLFIGAALFWSVAEQAGSTLTLFADRNTNLHAWDSSLWGPFRASYFQFFNPVMIIFMAPVFAWLWIRLGRSEPGSTAKFAFGVIAVGLSFVILIPVAGGTAVSPWWLALTYLLQTIGELCLSPVGLSAMTKLAPARIAGLIMGVWFLAASTGNYLGGRVASLYESFPLPSLFAVVAGFAIVVGVLLTLMIRPMKRLMAGVN